MNDPGFGVLGTPLSTAFIKEVNVLTGGYLPEYGRATGGHFDVVTKSGSNEFHGSIFAGYSPGIFEGPRRPVILSGNAITTTNALASMFDFGADLGGPIVRDKLWFYAGVSASSARYRLDRGISEMRFLAGQPVMSNGIPVLDPLADTSQTVYATQRSFQAIGNLTWRPNENNTLSLSVFGAPTFSGGDGTLGFTGLHGALEIDNSVNTSLLNGRFTALAHRYASLPIDSVLTWSTASPDRRLLFDTTVGWHHQEEAIRASDGSRIASGQGLSTVAQVFWQRTDPGPHSINDFEASNATRSCDDVTLQGSTRCPVSTYWSGGPGYLAETTLDRREAKGVLTWLVQAAGHHVIKAGAGAELLRYQSQRGYSGTTVYAEGNDGKSSSIFAATARSRPTGHRRRSPPSRPPRNRRRSGASSRTAMLRSTTSPSTWASATTRSCSTATAPGPRLIMEAASRTRAGCRWGARRTRSGRPSAMATRPSIPISPPSPRTSWSSAVSTRSPRPPGSA